MFTTDTNRRVVRVTVASQHCESFASPETPKRLTVHRDQQADELGAPPFDAVAQVIPLIA